MLLFASLVIERELPNWARLPESFGVWLQYAGGVAAFSIALVLLARWLQRDPHQLDFWVLPSRLDSLVAALKVCLIGSAVGYFTLVVIWVAARSGMRWFMLFRISDWILAISGALALLVALTPIVLDVVARFHWGRIWALARLSWKEAVRGRVIWVFGVMALVFLFAGWFVPFKAEDQVRNYVRIVYWAMAHLFLITAGLLGAFSIPNDVKSNSIHTIVTKPVERFEIVLGRFLGYAALLTVALFVVAAISLVYVIRGVNEEAKKESYTARVPIYGHLQFAGTKDPRRGEDVGREFAYRSYIKGVTTRKREPFRQFAIWDFAHVPADITARDRDVIFEFAFDIFRLSKGVQGKGVFCTLSFVNVSAFKSGDPDLQSRELDSRVTEMKQKYELQRDDARKRWDEVRKNEPDPQKQAAIEIERQKDYVKLKAALNIEYGIYEAHTELADFHTQRVVVPPEILKQLLAANPARQPAKSGLEPALRVFLAVDVADEAQMVGVAQHDLYLLAYERPFWLNFLKGVLGMWCIHMLVLGIAIALSTYLSSVISWLGAMFLFVAGMFTDYLREIAEYRPGTGGGPLEAGIRVTTRVPIAADLEGSPATSVVKFFDRSFSWCLGVVINLIPDINRHDLHHYVANGFDIGWTDLLLLDNALPLFGYLTPWAILAYYLMKFREIANPS